MEPSELRQRLERLNEGPEDAPERLELLAELAWSQRFQDWLEAEAWGEEAHRLATAAQNTRVRAQAGRALLMYRRWHHNLSGALEMGLSTLADFRQLEDLHGCAATLDGLATIMEELGDYPAALAYGREAYELAVQLDDPARKGWALSSLGGIHSACEEHEEAIRLLEEGVEAFESIGDRVGTARLSHRLGEALLKAGQIDRAREQFQRTIEATEKPGESRFVLGHSGLGDVARAQGDLAEAKRLYLIAGQNLLATGIRRFVLDVEHSLVELSLELGEIEAAETRLLRMLEEGQRAGAKPSLANIHALLAQTSEARGDPAAALHHYKRFVQLREEVLSDEARAKILFERNRRELESARKDAEIHRLRFVELAQMQAKLVETEKLAALGQLAAGVAHELNTPLGVMQSNLDVLRRAHQRIEEEIEKLGESEKSQRLLRAASTAVETSERAVQRVARFVRGVTSYSGVDQATAQDVDLGDCVETVLEVIGSKLPTGITVEKRLQPVPKVRASRARINQALMAVVVNAAEAMSGGGVCRVEVAVEKSEVVFRVHDSGPGIPPEQLERLFDVTFEASGPRVRLALGLPTVAATMDELGGRVEAESRVGEGTTIILRFPVVSPSH